MSYEKVKIVGVREIKGKNGQRHHFLQVEVLQSQDLYLNDDMLKNVPFYKQYQGHEVLLPCTWGEYQGRPSLNLSENGYPLPTPNQPIVDTKTGEIHENKPLSAVPNPLNDDLPNDASTKPAFSMGRKAG